jgi:hypothetical protein
MTQLNCYRSRVSCRACLIVCAATGQSFSQGGLHTNKARGELLASPVFSLPHARPLLHVRAGFTGIAGIPGLLRANNLMDTEGGPAK